MGVKRSHEEVEGVHSSRQEQVYGGTPKPVNNDGQSNLPASRHHLPKRSKTAHIKKAPSFQQLSHDKSVNSIKKRIRDVKRKLGHSQDLPANIRVEDERALEGYQQELIAAEEEKNKQKMIKRYHMVRFFERQKATRRVKKIRKRLLEAENTDEVEKIKVQLHIAEVDLNYTQHYPLNEPYIGLYANVGAVPEESDVVAKEKPPMWAEVERRMEEGGLDTLRNGTNMVMTPRVKPKQQQQQPRRALVPAESQKSKEKDNPQKIFSAPKAATKVGKVKKTIVEPIAEKVDDDVVSDGGFFEE